MASPTSQVEEFVARTTASSGVPIRVTDHDVLRRLVALLMPKKAS